MMTSVLAMGPLLLSLEPAQAQSDPKTSSEDATTVQGTSESAGQRNNTAGSDTAAGNLVGGMIAPLVATQGGEDADKQDVNATRKFGFGVGVFANTQVREWLALQLEVWYARKGATFEGAGTKPAVLDLSYIEVPVLARVQSPWRTARIAPYIVMGPEIAFSLSASYEKPTGGTLDVDHITKPTDIGMIVGGGATVLLAGENALVAEIRYDVGLTSIDDSGREGDIKNRTLFIIIGYQYQGLCVTSCSAARMADAAPEH